MVSLGEQGGSIMFLFGVFRDRNKYNMLLDRYNRSSTMKRLTMTPALLLRNGAGLAPIIQ